MAQNVEGFKTFVFVMYCKYKSKCLLFSWSIWKVHLNMSCLELLILVHYLKKLFSTKMKGALPCFADSTGSVFTMRVLVTCTHSIETFVIVFLVYNSESWDPTVGSTRYMQIICWGIILYILVWVNFNMKHTDLELSFKNFKLDFWNCNNF